MLCNNYDNLSSFQIVEAGKNSLPSWLHLLEKQNTLQGVPSPSDLGAIYLHAQGLEQEEIDPVFSVNVMDDFTSSFDTAAMKLEEVAEKFKLPKCLPGSAITMATVIVDTDVHKMSSVERVSLLKSLHRHLNLDDSLLKLMPVGSKGMYDSSALVAGPGNVKSPQHGGSTVQWMVGCGSVDPHHLDILQNVETSSADGSMAKAIGHGVVGWHVTNNRPQPKKRLRRQAIRPTQMLATPVPTSGAPTKLTGASVVVEPTITPTATDSPMTRTVPAMESPSFPVRVSPSTSHQQHRTKTQGRHHHKTKTTHIKHSPTRKPGHKSEVTGVPAPVPTATTIQPTKVTDMLTTRGADASVDRVMPTYSMASPGVSRTAGVIEPSMRTTELPVVMPTQVLPTHSYSAGMKDKVYPTETEKTPQVTEKPTTTTEKFDYKPILKNDIDRIDVFVGDILNYRIPTDTFYDFEDGDTTRLKLVLLYVNGMTIPPTSWIKFDQERQVIYGLPLPSDEGRREYLLSAIDSHGKIARDAFEVVVKKRNGDKFTHEFSVTLDLVYPAFIMSVNHQIEVAQKIAKLYGDNSTKSMTVINIAPGSVVYAWMNNSLPTGLCPSRTIQKLMSFLINENDTNLLNPALIEALKPIKVQKATLRPHGLCNDILKRKQATPPIPEPEQVAPSRTTSDEDVFITTVVPAVVIAAMLLLITCIVCILYRKKRKGKLYEEDKRAFNNKGIPIIFADELDDKADPPTKPLILTDEKPPLPPPEYQHLNSMPSTPMSAHKDPIDMSDDEEEETHLNSPPYQPPPPFTGSHGNRQARRPVQPSYRNPPPYVPP